jgi:hypothetical protein
MLRRPSDSCRGECIKESMDGNEWRMEWRRGGNEPLPSRSCTSHNIRQWVLWESVGNCAAGVKMERALGARGSRASDDDDRIHQRSLLYRIWARVTIRALSANGDLFGLC